MAGSQVAAVGSPTFTRTKTRRYVLIGTAVGLVLVLIIAVAVGVTVSKNNSPRNTDSHLQRAKALLDDFPVIDGHNDFPWNLRQNFGGNLAKANISSSLKDREGWFRPFNHPSQTDIPRLREGKVGGVFWSVFAFCESQFKDASKKTLQQIDLIRRFTAKYPEVFEFVTEADGIARANSRGRIASMIGIEGGHFIDNDMELLRMYHALGARYMTLTWSCNLDWADSYVATRNNETGHGGLTDWGKEVVKEMNRLGMLVDLSHVGWSTMDDVFTVSSAPVIYSHSSAFSICPHHRNVPDEILTKLKTNGGIIMVNLYAGFINCTADTRYISDNRTASIDQVLKHMDHLKSVVGVDHIGIGGDFDGMDRTVTDLEDVSKYPNLFAELLKGGWSEEDLKKVASQNIQRVWKAVEKVRDNLIDKSPYEEEFPGPSSDDHKCQSKWMYD